MVAVAVYGRHTSRRRFLRSLQALQAVKENAFLLNGTTMIRHACRSGTVTATSLGVHDAAARGCLIASAR